jgi:hypothetical protein
MANCFGLRTEAATIPARRAAVREQCCAKSDARVPFSFGALRCAAHPPGPRQTISARVPIRPRYFQEIDGLRNDLCLGRGPDIASGDPHPSKSVQTPLLIHSGGHLPIWRLLANARSARSLPFAAMAPSPIGNSPACTIGIDICGRPARPATAPVASAAR